MQYAWKPNKGYNNTGKKDAKHKKIFTGQNKDKTLISWVDTNTNIYILLYPPNIFFRWHIKCVTDKDKSLRYNCLLYVISIMFKHTNKTKYFRLRLYTLLSLSLSLRPLEDHLNWRPIEDSLEASEGSKSDLSILYDLSKYSENESEPKKWRLRALDKLGPNGQMNRQRL